MSTHGDMDCILVNRLFDDCVHFIEPILVESDVGNPGSYIGK